MENNNIIGTKYMSMGKNKRECTVVDIYTTYNKDGELIKTTFVSTHEFCGQIVTDYDVPMSSIVRGKIR